jgi:hypothetical protein
MRKGLLSLATALAIASCDDVYVHILTGQQYDPVNECVQAPAGIDVVSGGATGDNCDPTCLVATAGDSSFVYVTTTCPPYPGDYTAEGQDATTGPSDPCTGALAAYGGYLADGATCAPAVACGDGGDAAGDDGSGCTTAEAGDDGAGSAGDGGGSAGDDGGSQDAPTE